MPKSRAFTLIELVIALSVLITLATIAVPAMSNLILDQRVSSAANHLMTHLRFARGAALKYNTFISACPSPDLASCSGNRWETGWIVFRDPDRSGQPDSNDDILRVVQGDERLLLHSGGRYRVRFRPNGSAYGTNLTIRVCARDTARAVIVSNPGRVRATRDVDRADCEI
jgi:type IV fimbrial biogenesis protein FimT